jgi:hypothetical protein
VVFFTFLLKDKADSRRERESTQKIYLDIVTKLTSTLQENTESNKRIADEAKERNGHLAEIVKEAQDTAIKVAEANKKCYKDGFKALNKKLK